MTDASEFTPDALAEKLNEFHQKALEAGYTDAKVGIGRKIIDNPKYNNNPTALYDALKVKYPDLLQDLEWIKDWEVFLAGGRSSRRSGKDTHDSKPVSPVQLTDEEAVAKIQDFYRVNAPGNVPKAGIIWSSYKKRPGQLLQKLLNNYGAEQSSNLSWLQTYIQQHGPDEIPSHPTASSKLSSAPPSRIPMTAMEEFSQLEPDQIPLCERLIDFYHNKPGQEEKAKNVPKILNAKKGNERALAERLMSMYPEDAAAFTFLVEYADRKLSEAAPIMPRSMGGSSAGGRVQLTQAEGASPSSTHSRTHEVLLEQQQALQNQIMQQQALIQQQQAKIDSANSKSNRSSPALPSQPPPPVSTPAATVKEPTLRGSSQIGPSPVPMQSSQPASRGVDVNTLVAAGWIPPGGTVAATPFTSQFFPNNTRDRAVSTSPEERRTANASWAGTDASKPGFRNQLVQQIKELQDIHQELASHQKSQIELLTQQQQINQQVYPQQDTQQLLQLKGMQPPQPQQVEPLRITTLPPPPASPVKDVENMKRINALEEEMGRMRSLCSQLMGLVQQSYNTNMQQRPQVSQPTVTPPLPVSYPPVHSRPPMGAEHAAQVGTVGGYSTYVSQGPSTVPRVGVEGTKRKERAGFFSNLFHKKKERSPKRRGHSTHTANHGDRERDIAIERFRERVAHAEDLMRQFRKLSKAADSGSPGLKEDASFVQTQLSALSRTLREEAKGLHLLPPTPPRKHNGGGYSGTSSVSPSSVSTSSYLHTTPTSYTESSFTHSESEYEDSLPVKKKGNSSRRFASRRHR
eukprot:TRINITY_DN19180_c0_g1_i1.p1 TRINITY_DN19180_c0_g1~~TRINITY_DN19180_c0_g1_i1.p1  ORF type:complete len:800 (+),score=177.65 TRINITY_DN19180_c0_g1_i1:54-2453(+)